LSDAIGKSHRLKVGASVLLAAAVLCAIVAHWTSVPGPLGQMDAELRVGMSQKEAVAVLQAHDPGGSGETFFCGETRDGRQIYEWNLGSLGELPPGEQMARADVWIYDDGRDLTVTFGSGGTVTDLELKSDRWWEDWWCACSRPIPRLFVLVSALGLGAVRVWAWNARLRGARHRA
jgi:hypothetical protein